MDGSITLPEIFDKNAPQNSSKFHLRVLNKSVTSITCLFHEVKARQLAVNKQKGSNKCYKDEHKQS